jgi:hypothetical protein
MASVTTDEQPKSWSAMLRLAASAALLWHLSAVLVGPFSTPPTIPAEFMRPVFRAYISALDIDHAYKFFAPDPGPSHVLRYVLEMSDGGKQEGQLPDRVAHWPRLLYHRHFMLSEFIHDGRPSEAWTAEQPPADFQIPPHLDVYIRSYANHLLKTTGAQRVSLYYQLHEIPPPELIANGEATFADSRWRHERLLGTFTPTAESKP